MSESINNAMSHLNLAQHSRGCPAALEWAISDFKRNLHGNGVLVGNEFMLDPERHGFAAYARFVVLLYEHIGSLAAFSN